MRVRKEKYVGDDLRIAPATIKVRDAMAQVGRIGTSHKRKSRCRVGRLLRSPLDERGLTLIEVMIVVVLISILAYFVGPELTNWGAKSRLKAQSDQLFGAIQQAKIHAMKDYVNVDFHFNDATYCAGTNCYAFVDSNGNTVVNATMDDDGVVIATTFGSGDGFSPRGFVKKLGSGVWPRRVKMSRSDVANYYNVEMSVAGGITIEKH